MARLFNLFKELGFVSTEGKSEAELKEIEKKADAVEAAIVADAKANPAKPEPKPEAKPEQKPEPKPGDKAPELDPAVKAEIEGMKNTIAEMQKSQTERQDAEKKAAETAQRDAYKAHVQQLVKDGKITRAKGDEWMKDEAVARNAPALDVFKAATADLPADPKIRTANAAPEAKPAAQPAGGAQPAQPAQAQPMGPAIDLAKLTQDAKAEAASFLE